MSTAYEVVDGVTAEEAQERGLVVVEYTLAGGNAMPRYGYYFDSAAPGLNPDDAEEKPEAPRRGRPPKDAE